MKYEFKGTPGKWYVIKYREDVQEFAIESDADDFATDGRICSHKFWSEGFRSESFANAHLIAAAPQLLQALVAHTVINTDTSKWDVVGLNDECLFSHESIAQCNEYIHHLHGTAIHSALNIEK